jgi:glycosyltransferase involved in cell wall biosynthesis
LATKQARHLWQYGKSPDIRGYTNLFISLKQPKVFSMRIGLDAKWYFRGPISTQTILHNLLPLLFEYKEHEWIIFLDQKDKHAGFRHNPSNVTVQYVWAGNNLLSNVFILPRYIKKLKLDLIVFQTFPARVRVPSIAFIHDVLFREYPQFFTWKERMYFTPLNWLAKNATRVIATSAFVAKDLAKYNYTRPDQIDIVPLGVSRNFKPLEEHSAEVVKSVKEKYQLPDQFILYVGRLNARKNIEALLQALAMLQDQTIKLVIVGKEDWKAPNVQQLLLQSRIRERVVFTGSISNEDLPLVYALAKIFCFPSFAEGFGLPPLEAMGSGVPVIVSNTTAMPEVCRNAALYIDPIDPSAISKAINILLTNREKYNEMKQKGLDHALTFSWEGTASQFMKSIFKAVQRDHS